MNNEIIIYGSVPSQKNSKQIFRNSRTGAPFITSNQKVKQWQKDAALQLMTVDTHYDGKVAIDYHFYVKDNTRKDLDNMIATINDALVNAGIIIDDRWQYLEIAGARAEIDRNEPRCVLTVSEVMK